MRDGRTASRIAGIIAAVMAVLSIGGLIATVAIGLVGDKYDAYGEVPIPGSGQIQLPAGKVTVDFHVGTREGGLTVPPLHMDITPPAGLPDPTVKDDLGGTVTLGNDVHRQVWVMQVVQPGTYRITADGPVSGYINPRLAFGRTSAVEGPLIVFSALTVLSMDLLLAVWWFRRQQAKALPTDDPVRLEQLKTIAALRDSGALTADEFEAEKRRILDGR